MKASYQQVRQALDATGGDIRLFLLHGPDEAGAGELQAHLGKRLGADAERVDLTPAQLKSQPGLLIDEAASLSLFGGARYIRVTGMADECLEAVTLLLDATRAGNPVVAIAPSLKPASKLLKLALASPRALAHACYVPSGEEAERLVRAIGAEHGLRLAGSVPRRLALAAGGDRALMTREIEKLALFVDAAPDRPREADEAALDAVGADVGEAESGAAADAVLGGRPDALGSELQRLATTGSQAIPLLRNLARRLVSLSEMRSEIDRGASADTVLQRVFWRDRAEVGRSLRLWPLLAIDNALRQVRRAERDLLRPGTAGDVVAERALTAVAERAARRR